MIFAKANLWSLERSNIKLFWLNFQVSRFKRENLDVFALVNRTLVCGHKYVAGNSLFRGVVFGRGWIAANSTKLSLPLRARAVWTHILRGRRVKHNVVLCRRNSEGRGIRNCDRAFVRYLDLVRMNLVLFEQYWLTYTTWVTWVSRWNTEISAHSWLFIDTSRRFRLVVMAGKEGTMELASLVVNFLGLNGDIWINWIAPVLVCSEMKLLGVALDSCLLCAHISFGGLPTWMLLRIIRMTLLGQLETWLWGITLISLLPIALMTLLIVLLRRPWVAFFLHVMILKECNWIESNCTFWINILMMNVGRLRLVARIGRAVARAHLLVSNRVDLVHVLQLLVFWVVTWPRCVVVTVCVPSSTVWGHSMLR